MTDHVAGPNAPASSERVAELHRLADEDYAKGQQQRAFAHLAPSYAAAGLIARGPAPDPSDLDVAIRVAQQLLDSDQVASLREALRLMLRAHGAEPPRRCPAAHLVDTSACTGRPVVTILDSGNRGVDACEHHAARLLAVLHGGHPVALPDAPEGAALRVFTNAGTARRGEAQ